MTNYLEAVQHVSQTKLRKQAARGLRILDRHGHSDPALAGHEATFVPAAEGFIGVFDRVKTSEATRKRQVATGRQAVGVLYARIQAWAGALERDVPGFQASQLRGRTNDPDTLLGDAKRMIENASELEGAPYVQALTEDLGAALAEAQQAWRHTQDVLAEHQQLLADARTAAVLVNRELVALRHTLRAVLGSSHRDYHLLRTSRTAQTEDDEDAEPIVEEQTNPLTAAAQPTNGHAQPDAEVTDQ